jgi:enoyl-CoA hydratase/carnithine racemase
MTEGRIDLTQQDQIAQVTINDIPHHNAMSLAMWESLLEAFASINTAGDVRVCLLRGAGEKSFVSGANIGEFETQRSTEATVTYYNDTVRKAQQAIMHCRVPVIAAISGICYGGGLGLALSCDLRYASPEARFRMPAARMGLGYDSDSMRVILRNLGPQATAELFYSARVYNAAEAQSLGIVRSVVDNVFDFCSALAREIASNAPLTIQAAKKTLLSLSEGADMTAAKSAIDACFRSQDYAEGRLAFAQKRSPHFTGH